jgi:glycosyltransferase involved in cell wall biosynthesis
MRAIDPQSDREPDMPAAPSPTAIGAAGRKVLIVSPQPFYEDRGTPIAVGQLAAALSSLGFEVDLLAYPIGTPINLPRFRLLRGRRPFGIRSVRIGFSFKKVLLDLGMLGPLRALLRSGRYDAVHALEEMVWPVLLHCRGRNIQVIYDMQSSLPDQLRTHAVFRMAWVQRLLRKLENWALKKSNAVICSAGLLDHVSKQAPRTPAFEWKFPGQPRDESRQGAGLRERFGIAASRQVVMYAGTFEPYQGIDVLLEAMWLVQQELPAAYTLLIGATAGKDLGDNQMASRLQSAGGLKVVPRQPRETIPAYFAMADVLVSPRAYGDNIPLKIFDYVLSGKPIVATDIRAHRSILNDRTALLVPCTPTAMAEGILRLLTHAEHASSIAEAALREASTAPGKQVYVDLVQSLYHGTLNDRRRGPRGSPLDRR